MVSNEALFAVDVLTGSISVFFALTRLYIHFHRKSENRTWSDALGTFLLVLSAALAVPQVTLSRVDAYKTHLRHGKPVPPGEIPYAMQEGPAINHYLQLLLGLFSLWFIRLSYLVTFWAFRPTLTDRVKHALIVSTAVLVANGLAGILLTLLWCHPISQNWAVVLPGQPNTCDLFSPVPLSIVFAFGVSSDILIIVFSVILLSSLHLRTKRELAVFSLVFAVGAMSLFATIGRYVIIYMLETTALQFKGSTAWFNICTKLELLFATTAYGLTTARTFFRMVVMQVKNLSSYISKKSRRRSSFASSDRDAAWKAAPLVTTVNGGTISSSSVDREKMSREEFDDFV